ncbi:MAG: electron transfer flavoprotein subunit beta/FixA family protein [Acholeplasmatales bacterium]|jgi:electron transfer flavoprotein beta subunit|nr:electron transfer flavoprotein subunit beta/FixA family protein [Acholeplasmatales bacterium]
MNIVVLVKQVPDVSKVKIDPITNTLIRVGVPNIINPDDAAALEEALKIKDSKGAKVVTVTMGPPQAEGMIRHLYALGVDTAYLLTDRKFAGSDTLATSTIISEFLKKLNKRMHIDLILAGYQAIDGDTAQVGPQIAELLDIPQITHIKEIKKITASSVTVYKELNNDCITYNVALPALLTCISNMNTPRYMNAFNIWGAYEKPFNTVTFAQLNVDETKIGLAGSPTNVKRTFTKQAVVKAPATSLSPLEATSKILEVIKDYVGGNK